MSLLIVIVILALLFDYINGFHDAANSIATIVSTKVLTPFQAVLWAAFFNFVAYFIFQDHAVANTIGKTVHAEYITLGVILAGLIAAIFWNLLTWWFGIPSSSSHTLIGGFAGAALAHAGMGKGFDSVFNVIELVKISQIVAFIFLAPIIGMIISMLITFITMMRNLWLRIGFILLMAAVTFYLFDRFEQSKMNESIGKYYQLDKLKVNKDNGPEALQIYNEKKELVNSIKPLVKQYDELGATRMAAQIKETIDPSLDEAKMLKSLKKADNSAIVWGIMAVILIFILTYIYVEKIKTPNAYKVSEMFKKLQLISSAAFSIGHGGNDAQKVMGIIGAAYVAVNPDLYPDVSAALKDLTWVPLACYTAIGLGTMSGGWKIVKTMGTKITKVTALEGVCAESAGSFTLFMTEQMGIPVSTTHTITGAIIGAGASKRLSAVRWGITINLLWAWILTIPVSAVVAAFCYWLVTQFGIS
ncbi:MAG: inorganic phosphate transporter [Saprospiraceae bacterium]|nr:inorganic phosphate transporter [Saprospiraceae bacterium]